MVLLAGPWYRAAVATGIGVSHYSSTGSPPPQGVIGIGLSLIGAVAGQCR